MLTKPRVLLVAVLMTCGTATSRVVAWQDDVHEVLTFWLATQAGFSRQAANEIARASQSYDDSILGSAIPLVTHTIAFGSTYAAAQVQEHHFPSDGGLPSAPPLRTVAPNSPSARRKLDAALGPTPSGTALLRLGQALHPFHDSWSHQGIPDPPFVLRANLGFGHPETRGGWMSHDADLTYVGSHPSEVVDLAEKTFQAFEVFLKNNPTFRMCAAQPWSTLQPIVLEFAKAKDKSAWYAKHLIEPPNVAAACQGAGPLVTPKQQIIHVFTPSPEVHKSLVAPNATEAPPQLVKRAQAFLDAWLAQQDISRATAAVDWTALQRQLERYPSIRERKDVLDWCAVFMSMQLIENHELVNELGHGDPTAPGYEKLPRNAQRDGPFRVNSPREVRVTAAQLVPIGESQNKDANDDHDYLLILRMGRVLRDDVGLVWRAGGSDWTIVRMLAMPN